MSEVAVPCEHKPVYSKHRFPKQIALGTCRGCHSVITAPRRKTWCSDACKKLYDPYWVKKAVVARDKHICQMCGTDIRAAYLAWRRAKPAGTYLQEEWRKARPREEYDHIVPFSEGGTTVVGNMRTLCSACHKKRTAEWRKAKKEKT
ncbi:MAG: HNH endonuclease [bacterium ADurb.Bin374]|nr:MAG: HNH endonuclease [bacterium ADurb.Bin374]